MSDALDIQAAVSGPLLRSRAFRERRRGQARHEGGCGFTTVTDVIERIGAVASKLQVILGAKLTEAAASLAARLPVLGDDTGAIAFGRLGWDSSLTDGQLLRQNYRNGKLAESLVPGAGNTTRIVVDTSGKYRIPDILDNDTYELGEVKNVKYQSYTRQLKDYVSWAKKQDPPYTVNLIVRAGDGTKLTGPLKQAIANGDITIFKVLPK